MLSDKDKLSIETGCASKDLGERLQDAIDLAGGTNLNVNNVAELGATSNLTALVPAAAVITDSAGTFAIPAEPTGAEVDTAIDELRDKVETALDLKSDNTDVETLRTETEARLDAIEAKLDELIAALVASGIMLP